MRARQREFRIPVMVEPPKSPPVGIMAAAAVCAERGLVERILVAFRARHRRTAVGFGPMAFLARHRRMEPDEGELRQIMIE